MRLVAVDAWEMFVSSCLAKVSPNKVIFPFLSGSHPTDVLSGESFYGEHFRHHRGLGVHAGPTPNSMPHLVNSCTLRSYTHMHTSQNAAKLLSNCYCPDLFQETKSRFSCPRHSMLQRCSLDRGTELRLTFVPSFLRPVSLPLANVLRGS